MHKPWHLPQICPDSHTDQLTILRLVLALQLPVLQVGVNLCVVQVVLHAEEGNEGATGDQQNHVSLRDPPS